jgi:FMN phosphatase YigB (HAD superfamily)
VIRLVLLDWGGVLTEGEFDRQVSRDLATRAGAPEEDLYRAWRDGKRVAWERGDSDLEEVWGELAAGFGLAGGASGFAALLRGAIVPNAPVLDLLPPLRSRARLGLLSNNYPGVSPFVRKSAGALFDQLFFSDETGLVKPDPEAFRHALAAFDAAPAETLFVDDKDKNFPPARDLGIEVHAFRDAPTLRRELVTRGLLVA